MLAEPKLEDRPFQVLSWSVGVPRRLLILSPCVGVNTHYMARSLICGGPRCPACKSGIAGKYSGYVVVFWEGRNRLLRLTQGSAFLGCEAGYFVPGRVLIVEKPKERQQLLLRPEGDGKDVNRFSFVSRIQLLSIVCRLHGLPAVPQEITDDEAIDLVHKNGSELIRLAMKGALVNTP